MKKYEFTSKTKLKNALTLLEEKEVQCEVFNLGKLIIDLGEYDTDGNEIKPPVFTKNYCVDIIWFKDELEEFKEFEVSPKNPLHNLL